MSPKLFFKAYNKVCYTHMHVVYMSLVRVGYAKKKPISYCLLPTTIINRPGIARAVLQTHMALNNSKIKSVIFCLQIIKTP